MDGCFKWLIIFILLAIFIPLLIGGTLLAILKGFIASLLACDGDTLRGIGAFLFFVIMVIILIVAANE